MNKIFPILLGYNNNTLYGVENDVILIYNLFYNFYKSIRSLDGSLLWLKPIILINNEVNLNYIKNILKYKLDLLENKFLLSNIIIIIYFSGHSNSKGFLKFSNEYVNSNMCINIIYDVISSYKINTDIFFIIDSCFSKNFINNYNNSNLYINKISYLVSCMENEYSKEIETDYDESLFKYKNIKKNKKFIVGIFTLYLIKLIEARNIKDIYDFKNIIDDKLWKIISIKYKQTAYYEINNISN